MHIRPNAHVENYKKATKLAFVSVVANLPNFILVLISAFSARSAVVWVDVFVSFGETTHATLVWLVTWKMVREMGDKYNFGMARLEVFFSFVCDLIVTIGMIGVAIGAAYSIISPEAPTSSVLLFCILKCANSLYDAIALAKQSKITKENPSKLNETERITYRNSLISDVSVGLLALICYLLRDLTFTLYLSPIVSIGMAIYFIYDYIKHMRKSFREIVDASLPIPRQDEIYDIVLENRELVKRIESVNCRRINNKSHIEITLVFHDHVTYGQIHAHLEKIRPQIEALEPDCFVCLVVG